MKYLLRHVVSGFVLIVVFISTSLNAQSLTNSQKEETVNNIARLLKDHYVFPEIGEECGSHIISKFKEGVFKDVSTPEEFAKRLTSELQSISKDKHMRVRQESGMMETNGSIDQFYQQYKFKIDNEENNYGFRKVQIFDGDIGYIDLRGFAQSPEAIDVAVSAMNFIKNSDALIFDLRKNGGGSPEMVKFILSYFFDEPTHINDLYWRDGDTTVEYWTNEKVEGKKMADVPLYVLTSNYTFSGGEEFTYDVQTQKRGIIIGEVTGGGANPGNMFSAGNGIAVFIPTGRAINPVTKTNWEGVGVKPDIEIPADDALNKAIELARMEAEKYKKIILSGAEKDYNNFEKQLDESEGLFNTNRSKANEKLSGALNTLLQKDLLGELDINNLGYQYLNKQKYDMAVAIFTFNTEKFPESSNVWDSLGEAYMDSGKNGLAIKNYKKSLELDSHNDNARRMIEKMQKGN